MLMDSLCCQFIPRLTVPTFYKVMDVKLEATMLQLYNRRVDEGQIPGKHLQRFNRTGHKFEGVIPDPPDEHELFQEIVSTTQSELLLVFKNVNELQADNRLA